MLLRNLKNSFILILTFIFLGCCPVISNTVSAVDAVSKVEVVQNKSLLPGQKEKKHVLNKFFVTMLWVCGSCFVIFSGLLLYKRFKDKRWEEHLSPEPDISQNLNSPDTLDEAAEFVIKKF